VELITKYPTIRCFAAAFLEVFEFRGGAAVSNWKCCNFAGVL
jgi:hypothetical protein